MPNPLKISRAKIHRIGTRRRNQLHDQIDDDVEFTVLFLASAIVFEHQEMFIGNEICLTNPVTFTRTISLVVNVNMMLNL
ncbi:hypothetical protein ANTQUA_LOCUS427 [Anthophora quadrimaculata]